LKLIKLISMCVLLGAMLAVGIPRGFGKTSMCVRAVIWAIAYRHHTLVILIAATSEAAAELINDIHTELTTNELLRADFPELCLPLIHVGSANQKGRGQLCEGQHTNVKVRANELWTGDVLGRHGASIWAAGITSSFRGKRRTVDGMVLRPTLGLADDCQTRSSASSEKQNNRRKKILQADLPGLPGPSDPWSLLSTWTVIEPEDTADWVLDRDKAPDYHGVRECFLDSLPDESAMDLWNQWNEIRIRCQQETGAQDIDLDAWEDGDDLDFGDHDPLEPAHEFFDKHKKKMLRGAKVVWEHAYNPARYRCALEKAMHWYFRDRLAFYSELQNNPAAMQIDSKPQLKKFDVATRFGRHKRGCVPTKAQWLTAGIDVQGKCLFWSVRAWAQDSTSWVIEYGTWPGQSRSFFTLADIKLSLDSVYSNLPTWDVRLARGLTDLLDKLFNQQWPREDGAMLGLTAGGVDANWETQAVRDAVQASGYYGRVYPTHGRSYGPGKTPLNDTAERERDVVGDNWRLRSAKAGDTQFVTFDCDVFKSFQRDRLLMDPLQPGALTLFDGPSHDMWAGHMCAEQCKEFIDKESHRIVDVWSWLPHRPDNHFLDCEGINNVVGSMIGCRLPLDGHATAKKAIGALPTSHHAKQAATKAAYKPFSK